MLVERRRLGQFAVPDSTMESSVYKYASQIWSHIFFSTGLDVQYSGESAFKRDCDYCYNSIYNLFILQYFDLCGPLY